MDQEAVETNSQKSRWIKIVITTIEKGSSIGSTDSLAIETLSRLLKNSFSRRENHRYECNQACYSNKDPNNILSSQKHLSTRKMSII